MKNIEKLEELEELLRKEGLRISEEVFMAAKFDEDPEWMIVVLVTNSLIKTASIAFSEDELNKLKNDRRFDPKRKKFYLVPTLALKPFLQEAKKHE